ncbi:MAG TPA: glycosyltransferase family 4 protein [Thermoleophilaceae bacterium]|nr:glycosyltransferase family 4 protein [Thermoleophilaceae bacterium]
MRPRVVILRGHQVNPWELRPWEELSDRYDVRYLRSGAGWFDDSLLQLTSEPARTLRERLPRGRAGDLLVRFPGDRYLGLESKLRGAVIVHSQELGYWYSAQAARLRPELGFKLVLTVWETIPFLDSYRNVRTRRYRRVVLEQTDLFLAATERARDSLLLEGADPSRIRVVPPGVDLERFGGAHAQPPREHVVLSVGRLVWEKGHQDVLRALAALRRGVVAAPSGAAVRVVIVGAGEEEARLERYAAELGVADRVEFRRHVPYEEMPRVFAEASCMVLASLPRPHWEEQFGMVLAEAMAAGVPIVASTSGAIPEVTGPDVAQVAPGDWVGLARALADGPLARPPATRAEYDDERVQRFGTAAAAARLAAAYDELLGEAARP